MVSSSPVPWYNVPARPFPAKVWLEQRYPFRVSPAVFAWRGVRSAHSRAAGRRRFPAQEWLEEKQAGFGVSGA